MRIAIAIKGLGVAGGVAEIVFVEIASGLAARGHAVSAISYDWPEQVSFYPLAPAVDWVRLGVGRTYKPARLLESASRIGALRRTVQQLTLDIVMGFMHSMFIPLGLALVGLRVPMIASEHIGLTHFSRRPLQRGLMRLSPLLVRRITVVTDQIRAEFPPSLRKRMVVIPNPVSQPATPLADTIGSELPRKMLLSVGLFGEQRDFPPLIRAFASIAGAVPDWYLRIVGDGDLRPHLEELVAQSQLTDRVVLPGATKNIGAQYAAAQLFVLPSSYESLGLVLIEALAHGLPAVGFADCLGVNLLIRPGWNGVLVSGPDRVVALGEALLSLMVDGRRAALIPAEPKIPPEFGCVQALDQWEDLLACCT
ncbi:MAG: glycosyltransferase [Rhodospirillaceae bacterium]|nr:glycosyltransferase [Rhodospirillaceae bacterium]